MIVFQSTEWNSITVSIWPDPKLYTSETAVIRVLFVFEGDEKTNVWTELFLSISFQDVK